MKNKPSSSGTSDSVSLPTRPELPRFFKCRIYILLIFILQIWLIALLFAISDIMPLLSWYQDIQWQADHPDIQHCEPGPWGDIRYSRIEVEAPDGFLTPDNTAPKQTKWFFEQYSAQSLAALMERANLTEPQKELFFQGSRRESSPEGITVYPDPNFVLNLSPESRATIYEELARSEENFTHKNPFTFELKGMDEWLESSGLPPNVQALMRHLSYTRGAKKAFADVNLVLAELTSPEERIHFYKAASRTASVFPKLHISKKSNIEAIARYWMKDGKAKDIRPLLKSMAGIDGGSEIDLVHLLPPLVRRLAYTHPNPAEIDFAAPPDCHWTSLNFFNSKPDDSCLLSNTNRWDVEGTYYQVRGKPTLGDIILLVDSNMKPVHSCSYIADGLVFTKNGLNRLQPWIFMKLEDVISIYNYVDFETIILRRKGT